MSMSNTAYEYMTSLQCQVKALRARVSAFESGDKYIAMEKDFKRQLAAKDRQIKKLKTELGKARTAIVNVRNIWLQVIDDLQAGHAIGMLQEQRKTAAMKERALKAEKRVDDLKDDNLALKRKCYALETELAEERDKNQKFIAQLNRDHENSSIPSSQKPNRKPITNNRVKTGKTPGAQAGHEHHGRKKQEPTRVIELSDPSEYLNNPDYEPTGRLVRRQQVGIKVIPFTTEYVAAEFKHKKTGKLVYADFPAGVKDDVNYDGSVKAFAFLLNNYCNVSLGKTKEMLYELTGGALDISTGMINGLSKEFSAKSAGAQSVAFLRLVNAKVLHVDFTSAKVNGKNVNVAICATEQDALYSAREQKGHEGVKGTPAEFNNNTLVHDHDMTFYNYGMHHQDCLIHVLRYLLSSIQNEKNLTWSKLMRDLLTEMIHYRNSLKDDEELDVEKVREFEERYGQILDIADREYEYEPPNKYFKDGYNLKARLREFKEAHLLFLHDKNVPTNNNLAERLLRVFKRKFRQVMTFRSFKSLGYLCDSLTILANLYKNKANLYESVAHIFEGN